MYLYLSLTMKAIMIQLSIEKIVDMKREQHYLYLYLYLQSVFVFVSIEH